MDNDMLSSLLKNPEALQNAMRTVSGMLSAADASPNNAAPPDNNAPPFSPLDNNNNSDNDGKQSNYDPSADLIQRSLPMIHSIVQSGQGAVRQEKRTLLNAVKPFVNEDVAKQFDHAMRLVSMAKMANAALGQINATAPPNENDTGISQV